MAVEKVKKEEVTSSLSQRINPAQSEINLALWEEGVEWSKPCWIKWMTRKGWDNGRGLVTTGPSVQPPAVYVLWVTISTWITLIPLCLSHGSLQGWALPWAQPWAGPMLAVWCQVKHWAVLLTEAMHCAYCAKFTWAGHVSPGCWLKSSCAKECAFHTASKQCRDLFYLRV